MNDKPVGYLYCCWYVNSDRSVAFDFRSFVGIDEDHDWEEYILNYADAVERNGLKLTTYPNGDTRDFNKEFLEDRATFQITPLYAQVAH